MNDFETRLTEALNGGAEQAPDADGLAAGARRRSRTRRRTRVAVGIGVVVAALVVPVGVLALGGDDTPDRVATDTTEEPQGWHTVEHEGVLLDIPGGWHELDTSKCEFGFARFGPTDADACTFDHEGLGFYASASFDPKHGPGVLEEEEGGWGGYVYAGDWAIYATVSDPDRARRILASARLEGQEAPDLSAGWRTESIRGTLRRRPRLVAARGPVRLVPGQGGRRLGGDPRDDRPDDRLRAEHRLRHPVQQRREG